MKMLQITRYDRLLTLTDLEHKLCPPESPTGRGNRSGLSTADDVINFSLELYLEQDRIGPGGTGCVDQLDTFW